MQVYNVHILATALWSAEESSVQSSPRTAAVYHTVKGILHKANKKLWLFVINITEPEKRQ